MNSERVAFFFGAGASKEFGIPSMKEMTKSFSTIIAEDGDSEEIEIFEVIRSSLEKIYGKNMVDLESIMSIIVGLKDRQNIRDSIGDLGLFFLEKKGIKNPQKILNYQKRVIISLENKFKNHIREKVFLTSKDIDRLRHVYFDFFKQICMVMNCSNTSTAMDTDYNTNTYSSWRFFTTNYDNSLEEYWVNFRKYELDLGFKRFSNQPRKIMAPQEFVQNNRSNSYFSMQLIKLHGSVNWIRNTQNQIEEHEYNSNLGLDWCEIAHCSHRTRCNIPPLLGF